MEKMNHASLFTGIGGFDLAASWMGWNNVFQCEIDPFCQKVLRYHFPETILLGDIKKAKFKRDERGNLWVRKCGIIEDPVQGRRLQRESNEEGAEIREQRDVSAGNKDGIYLQEDSEDYLPIPSIDILTGGFPCQPFSMAGKRKGTDDPRHLWPEMLRAIRDIQPRFVVGENVGGLINWSGGLVFEQVQADLENEGYEVQAFVLPACAVNAPHRRDRVWIVAHAKHTRDRNGMQPDRNRTEENKERNGFSLVEYRTNGNIRTPADTEIKRHQIRNGEQVRNGSYTTTERHNSIPNWHNFPTQPPVRTRNDGFSGKLDGITVSKLRNESIKAAGNAIVPQVSFEIFKAIESCKHNYL